VFYKTVIEGIEIADVANHFGVTSNVVYLARSRVLRRVRECMQDLYGHDILFN
jgi:DNA-directed RNA polymerase specialized sigma24 family protein